MLFLSSHPMNALEESLQTINHDAPLDFSSLLRYSFPKHLYD